MDERRATELNDLARVLLLLQGAILITNTVEAALFATAFSGGLTPIVLFTAVAAIAILVARGRLDRSRRARRVVMAIEVVTIASLAIDALLAITLAHASVPMVAVLTRFALPLGVIGTLVRMGRARIAASATLVALEKAA